MEQLEVLNRSLFLKINAAPGTAAWQINSATFVADKLIYLIPVLLLALWLWGDERKRNIALKTCLVAMLGLGVNQLIGLVWQHPRPFMIGLGHTWIPHVADSSFPSDHATVFAAMGLVLFFAGKIGLAILTLLVAACVAWARVFLGVHFPMDMLGALGVAAWSDVFVTLLWRKMGKPITNFAEHIYRKLLAQPIAAGWIRH